MENTHNFRVKILLLKSTRNVEEIVPVNSLFQLSIDCRDIKIQKFHNGEDYEWHLRISNLYFFLEICTHSKNIRFSRNLSGIWHRSVRARDPNKRQGYNKSKITFFFKRGSVLNGKASRF